MDPISEEVWQEILFNQQFPLIGEKKPGSGNGFHDRISWSPPMNTEFHSRPEYLSFPFYSIYLRDLRLQANPNYHNTDCFQKGIILENCSENYQNTLKRFLTNSEYIRHNIFIKVLGDWTDRYIHHGRLIFEIVGWYTNETKQLYAFQLFPLSVNNCKIGKKMISYNAPYEHPNGESSKREEKIPIDKCIIVDFPKELGGYKEFKRKEKHIRKLGPQFKNFIDPAEGLAYRKEWEIKYNKIINDWSTTDLMKEVTDFYQITNRFRLGLMARLCAIELTNGIKQLLDFLNGKLQEQARINVDLIHSDIQEYRTMNANWMDGKLTLKDSIDYLTKQ